MLTSTHRVALHQQQAPAWQARGPAQLATIAAMSAAESMGSDTSQLIVIRGNSGSGKSTIAHELRRRCGRSWALVEQDYLRRIVLWEHDKPGGLAPALIAHTVRFALDNGFDVILEGILHTARYRDVVASLWRAHRGRTSFFWLSRHRCGWVEG